MDISDGNLNYNLNLKTENQECLTCNSSFPTGHVSRHKKKINLEESKLKNESAAAGSSTIPPTNYIDIPSCPARHS